MAYGIPRFISVKLYVPEAEQGLPDWEVLDGNNMDQVKGYHTLKLKTLIKNIVEFIEGSTIVNTHCLLLLWFHSLFVFLYSGKRGQFLAEIRQR